MVRLSQYVIIEHARNDVFVRNKRLSPMKHRVHELEVLRILVVSGAVGLLAVCHLAAGGGDGLALVSWLGWCWTDGGVKSAAMSSLRRCKVGGGVKSAAMSSRRRCQVDGVVKSSALSSIPRFRYLLLPYLERTCSVLALVCRTHAVSTPLVSLRNLTLLALLEGRCY